MKAILKLDSPEEILETEIDARDRRAFERVGTKETGVPIRSTIQETVRSAPETYMGWLAWHALMRVNGKQEIGDWISFERRLISVDIPEIELEEEHPFGDPTRAAKLGESLQ